MWLYDFCGDAAGCVMPQMGVLMGSQFGCRCQRISKMGSPSLSLRLDYDYFIIDSSFLLLSAIAWRPASSLSLPRNRSNPVHVLSPYVGSAIISTAFPGRLSPPSPGTRSGRHTHSPALAAACDLPLHWARRVQVTNGTYFISWNPR